MKHQAPEPPTPQTPTAAEPRHVRAARKRLVVTAIVLFAVAASVFAYVTWFRPEPFPDGLIQANGRMEGDHVTIASKFFGRVAELLAYEGDEITQGEVVVRLEDEQTQAKVDQAREAVAVCQAQIRAAEAKIEAATAKLKAGETSLELLRKEVPLAIDTAEAQLAHANAAAATADSTEGNARREVERHRRLAPEGATSQQELDKYELLLAVARNKLTTAQAAVTKATKQLAEAKLGADRIKAKEDEVNALRADLSEAEAARTEKSAARAQAQAVLAEAQVVLDELTIIAPSSGVIVTRTADAGEVVAAGTPLFDLVDLDRLYLKVYIPQVEIGKVRLGLRARIHTDAFPDRPFPATVRYISSRAEFTPKEVQTPDERVKLVYAVRLYLDENPDHCLNLGLPADAVIRWKDDVPWAEPRW